MYSHIQDSTMERYSPDSKNRHQTMYSHIQDSTMERRSWVTQ